MSSGYGRVIAACLSQLAPSEVEGSEAEGSERSAPEGAGSRGSVSVAIPPVLSLVEGPVVPALSEVYGPSGLIEQLQVVLIN